MNPYQNTACTKPDLAACELDTKVSDMQIKVNILIAELRNTIPFINHAVQKTPYNSSMVADGLNVLNRIEILSKWKE